MRVLALVAVLALAPQTLLAHPAPGQTTSLIIDSSSSHSCPVDFDVRRNSPGLVANVRESDKHSGSQRIYFQLRSVDDRAVQSIRITVHAFSPKSRLYPAGVLTEPTPDIHRDFEIADPASIFPKGRNLWVDGVGGIVSVDLTSISYTDGSRWHASSGSTCHVIPNGFTPVNLSSTR